MIETRIVPRIRERLAETGRRPLWLSEQTGIDPSAISRILGGKPVSLLTAFQISAALGVSIESLWVIQEVEVDQNNRA